jgi:hypothetical protein
VTHGRSHAIGSVGISGDVALTDDHPGAIHGAVRSVRLRLTPLGSRRLAKLSAQHLEELRRLGSRPGALSDGLEPST